MKQICFVVSICFSAWQNVVEAANADRIWNIIA